MKNERLYQSDVYLKEADGEIIAIRESQTEEHYQDVLINPCLFFPTGGGQSCDLGSVAGFELLDVYEDEEKAVWCTIKADDKTAGLKKGDMVHMILDWERRFDNMQRHCGEHILSGTLDRLFGGVNRGFHMGADYMTLDMNLEKNPEIKDFTWEMAMQAELEANKVIWRNEAVTTFRFETRAEAEKMPLRKPLAFDEDISIVCVGDTDCASDCIACCGTHPSTAGQVGLIKIYKVENYKGMFRIYCDAGQRAFKDFENKHEIITKLNQKYSAVTDDLIEKISDSDKKTQELRDDYFALKKTFMEDQVESIRAEIAKMKAGEEVPGAVSDKIYLKEITGLKLEEMLHIGRPLIEELPLLLLLLHRQSNTLLLFSNGKDFDCGKLVKDNVFVYNGKGGGSNTNARAIFSKDEYTDTFVELLKNHLR